MQNNTNLSEAEMLRILEETQEYSLQLLNKRETVSGLAIDEAFRPISQSILRELGIIRKDGSIDRKYYDNGSMKIPGRAEFGRREPELIIEFNVSGLLLIIEMAVNKILLNPKRYLNHGNPNR